MANKLRLLILPATALLLLPLVASAQMVGGGMGMGMGAGGMGMGESGMGGQGTGNNQGNQSGFTSPEDLMTATAPPFDVGDVIRMHHVGLSDIVIINALRTRYDPIMLTKQQKTRLKTAGVDARVIYAMEDPFNIGLARVRADLANEFAAPPPSTASTKQKPTDSDSGSTAEPTRYKVAVTHSATAVTQASAEAASTAPQKRRHSQPPAPAVVSAHRRALTFSPLPPVPALAPHGSLSADLNLSHAPFTSVPPEPVTEIVSRPEGHGIFLRYGSRWQHVDQESVYWQHRGHGYRGSVLRPGSDTATYPGGTDFLIITPADDSALQYQLVHLRQDGAVRTFRPNPPGEVYSAGLGADLVSFDPVRVGPSLWFVSLHDLEPGQYGFLPPAPEREHSTTGLATTIYTFDVQ